MNKRVCIKTAGFTLLEMLVAVSIFAIMSAMAYGGLRTVLDTRDHVERQTARLAELQTAFILLERDIEQLASRPVRDAFGGELPPLAAGNGIEGLEFTRSGWRNPLGRPRSNLERVAYMLKDNQLVRRDWAVLDRAPNTLPADAVLLEGVKAVEARFLDQGMQWQSYWPLPQAAQNDVVLPRAIELGIEMEGIGRVTRLFRVPG